jgi:hypothetical protein
MKAQDFLHKIENYDYTKKDGFVMIVGDFYIHDVELLKDFEELKKGSTAQIVFMPGRTIDLGKFNKLGSGTCYKSNAVEGIDFKFI